MESKRVLVYDNQHGFSRFLKKEFGKVIDFKVYKNFDSISSFDTIKEDYSFIIFIIYSEDDLFDFIKIHGKGLPIVICSFKAILNRFDNNNGFSFIDISRCKKELLNDFQFFLHA
jgi:hypothetical protein